MSAPPVVPVSLVMRPCARSLLGLRVPDLTPWTEAAFSSAGFSPRLWVDVDPPSPGNPPDQTLLISFSVTERDGAERTLAHSGPVSANCAYFLDVLPAQLTCDVLVCSWPPDQDSSSAEFDSVHWIGCFRRFPLSDAIESVLRRHRSEHPAG